MTIINNRLDGKPDNDGMSGDVLKAAKGVQVSDDMVKASGMYREFNRQVAVKVEGTDKINAFRGVTGDYANNIKVGSKASGTKTVDVPTHRLTSFSQDPDTAGVFADMLGPGTGVVLKGTISLRHGIWSSHHTDSRLAELGESELVTLSKGAFTRMEIQ